LGFLDLRKCASWDLRKRAYMKKQTELPKPQTISKGHIESAFCNEDWRQKKRIKIYGQMSRVELLKRIKTVSN
jgi:hypothetical protein